MAQFNNYDRDIATDIVWSACNQLEIEMQNVLIIGGGFAGVWAAMSAAAELNKVASNDISIRLVSDQPNLTIRPRLYEGAKETMRIPLRPLTDEIGVEFEEIDIAGINSAERIALVAGAESIPYDKLILATGSRLRIPPIPGADSYSFSVDTFIEAARLDRHLEQLGGDDHATNTVVVVGASFTGVEIATELRGRLPQDARIVLVDSAQSVGLELGPNVQPVIDDALVECEIETILGVEISEIHEDSVRLNTGQMLGTRTVILATGMEASPLTADVGGERDAHGRLTVDPCLRVEGVQDIFAAGDTARAMASDEHVTLMSCQHAMPLGTAAGRNAICDLVGQPATAYRQEDYATCLDLGRWGAVFTNGWDRVVAKSGQEAKAMKVAINRQWIYPPNPKIGRDAIFRFVSGE